MSQINSLLVLENTRLPGKSTSGIQIVLSLSELDRTDVGYQKPKPQGFAASRLAQRKLRILIDYIQIDNSNCMFRET